MRVNDLLQFGDLTSCQPSHHAATTVVHACKAPCHRRAAGYNGSLKADHPDYLFREEGCHLYLNLIDPPVPLFQLRSFALFFDFLDRQPKDRPVLIHCNKGESRAPSLTLLYMAKRLGLLPDTDYAAARAAFETQFPYKPGKGIAQFLEENWGRIG